MLVIANVRCSCGQIKPRMRCKTSNKRAVFRRTLYNRLQINSAELKSKPRLLRHVDCIHKNIQHFSWWSHLSVRVLTMGTVHWLYKPEASQIWIRNSSARPIVLTNTGRPGRGDWSAGGFRYREWEIRSRNYKSKQVFHELTLYVCYMIGLRDYVPECSSPVGASAPG